MSIYRNKYLKDTIQASKQEINALNFSEHEKTRRYGKTVTPDDANSDNSSKSETTPNVTPTATPTAPEEPKAVNPYNQKYTDTTALMESAYESTLNGNDEIAELNKQAASYAALGDEYTRKYLNRDKFNYDINTDAMYAMYRDQFEKNAKIAQREAQAQAAGATGGYGSTYASAMGNMAYSAEMDKLNDKATELYANAYDRYLQDGQELLNQAALANSQAEALNTRAAGIRQDSLTTAALAGEYGNYLYSKTDEGIAAAEAAEVEASEKEAKETRRAAMTRLNSATAENISGYKSGRIDDKDKTGWDLVGDAIDIDATLFKKLENGDWSADTFVDELFSRLEAISIDGESLSSDEIQAYLDTYVYPKLKQNGLYAKVKNAIESE